MAGKLHELIAVEGDLKSIVQKILEETIITFTKKQDHFTGFLETLEWFDKEAEAAPEKRKAWDTTVADKLSYQKKHLVRFYDAVLQKETTNQIAIADIVIDGKVIAQDIPAGFLLGLEKLLKNLRNTYESVPTLPPGMEWVLDPETGENVYKRKFAETKYKTEKTIVPQILYKATDKHPAQVDKISETKNVGRYTTNQWCTMITPAQKSRLLGRLDNLYFAVKKARQRANNTEVVKVTIGEKLFDYIDG